MERERVWFSDSWERPFLLHLGLGQLSRLSRSGSARSLSICCPMLVPNHTIFALGRERCNPKLEYIDYILQLLFLVYLSWSISLEYIVKYIVDDTTISPNRSCNRHSDSVCIQRARSPPIQARLGTHETVGKPPYQSSASKEIERS